MFNIQGSRLVKDMPPVIKYKVPDNYRQEPLSSDQSSASSVAIGIMIQMVLSTGVTSELEDILQRLLNIQFPSGSFPLCFGENYDLTDIPADHKLTNERVHVVH